MWPAVRYSTLSRCISLRVIQLPAAHAMLKFQCSQAGGFSNACIASCAFQPSAIHLPGGSQHVSGQLQSGRASNLLSQIHSRSAQSFACQLRLQGPCPSRRTRLWRPLQAKAESSEGPQESARQKSPPSRAAVEYEGQEAPLQLPSQFLEYLPESARPLPKQLGVLVTTWRSRALSFARESILLIYSALIDNTLVVVLERLQLDKLLRRTQPWLERGSARLFGSYHELADGTRVPISLVNNTGPDFDLPNAYKVTNLAFGAPRGSGYNPDIAQFLALCMKVVYEEPAVIQDISERLWGLKFHGYFSTQTPAGSLYDVENKNTADFIPRTRACMLSNTEAVIIAFRGSEPLNLINLRSSGKITMRPRFGFGRLHDGFHAALFHSDVEKGSLYAQIVECLMQINSTKNLPIFLSGHSLGGALTQVFAAALAAHHPELADRVSGMYTYGMPRVGDSAFSLAMEARYPGCAFRITHAADIIPLVPPKFLEYRHFGEEHYLTSLGREVRGQKDIAGARRVETLGFLPLYMWKLVAGLALNPKEGSLRTLYRLVMLVLLPGLNDHFPADYNYKLERLLR